jgi:hypothetical protein
VWHEVGMPAPGSPLSVWAEAQFGLVTRGQCLGAGMSEEEVRWRVASGRWTRRHRGVYLTLPGKEGWDVDAMAAFLCVDQGLRRIRTSPEGGGSRSAQAAGGGERSRADGGAGPSSTGSGVVSAIGGAAAAYLWGLVATPPRPIEVVVPGHRRVATPAGARVRRLGCFDLALDERLYPWRLGPTAAALEVAAAGDADGALAVVARGLQKRLVSASGLASELAARGRHPHGRLLREVLADLDDGAHSAAEVRYVRDVERAHGLPGGARQQSGRSGPARVHDTVYEVFGVVVEVDGRLGHEGWENRVRDGRRDRLAAGEGRFTTRVFWTDVAVTPCRTAAEVGAVLRARGWPGRPHRCGRTECAVGSGEGCGGAGPANPPAGAAGSAAAGLTADRAR